MPQPMKSVRKDLKKNLIQDWNCRSGVAGSQRSKAKTKARDGGAEAAVGGKTQRELFFRRFPDGEPSLHSKQHP